MTTADTLPEPLVPADADLKDFAFTPIYRARLFGSAFHAKASDAEWRAGVTLWLKSQDQKPAGSLPADDVELCRLAELGRDMKTWKKIKAMALHGWFECSDGRLYNQVVAEIVNEQWEGRRAHIERREKWREKKAKQRGDKPDMSEGTALVRPVGHDGMSPGTSGNVPRENALKGQGQGQGQGQGKEIGDRRSLPQPRAPASARVDDAQAETLIAAADRVIAEHFGRPRPRRHRDDAAIARVWAARGIVPDRLAAILDAAVGRYAAGRPGDLPVSLRLFETDVDREEPPSPYPPGITSADDRQWWDRVVVWRLKGAWFERNGPPPDDPGTLVPDRVLVGHGLNRRKDAAA